MAGKTNDERQNAKETHWEVNERGNGRTDMLGNTQKTKGKRKENHEETQFVLNLSPKHSMFYFQLCHF